MARSYCLGRAAPLLHGECNSSPTPRLSSPHICQFSTYVNYNHSRTRSDLTLTLLQHRLRALTAYEPLARSCILNSCHSDPVATDGRGKPRNDRITPSDRVRTEEGHPSSQIEIVGGYLMVQARDPITTKELDEGSRCAEPHRLPHIIYWALACTTMLMLDSLRSRHRSTRTVPRSAKVLPQCRHRDVRPSQVHIDRGILIE